jgi:PadR family transcriptional regulator PadR
MTDKINPELFKGSAVTVLLTVLSRREMYGYELMKEIERRSSGSLEITEGTLYPVLHQLEKNGAIEARWEETQSARKRKFYRITAEGKRLLAQRKREWRDFRAMIDQFITGREVLS